MFTTNPVWGCSQKGQIKQLTRQQGPRGKASIQKELMTAQEGLFWKVT